MKKLFLSLLIFATFSACEKSPLFDEYAIFSGKWNISNTNNSSLQNGQFDLVPCKFMNKNLKNGKHVCIGTIQLNGGKLDLLFKVAEGQVIDFQTVSFNGSFDPTKTTLPLQLFKGVWSYQHSENTITLTKKESENKAYLNYVLELKKVE